MDPLEEFERERKNRLSGYRHNEELRSLSHAWRQLSMAHQYVYNFDWLGLPIIQYPQDIVALQEIVWKVRPDVIVETGIARGGSVALSASLLALLDYCDAAERQVPLDPAASRRRVIGVDIDIRDHNRKAIEAHPLAHMISLVQGSSTVNDVVAEVRRLCGSARKVLVCLDSNHTHDHVVAELHAYAPLVTAGSYCIVFDTFVEDLPMGFFSDRPWDVGNNPKTAVREFLSSHPEFEIDQEIETKLQITVAPEGFLRRTR